MPLVASRRSHPPRRALFLCALLLTAAPAVAQEQRAVLDLIVNDVPQGEALVIIRGSDALIRVSSLRGAGLERIEGTLERIGSDEFVSLASLAPRVEFAIDEQDLDLTLTVDPELLAERATNLRIGEPEGLVFRSDTSGFVNYALGWSDDRNQYDLFTESAVSTHGALVYNTLSANSGLLARGVTNVTLDQRAWMRRWVFGDAFAATGVLGGAAPLAGITLSREFAVAPYFIRYPSLSLSTPISVPSVVEVRVNDRLVSQEQVAPGRMVLENLPLTTGRNDARIIVRDPFGGTREISASYYLTTSVLAAGVHDYQYSLGFQRNALGTRSWDYSSPALLARHRIGLTEALTAGGRVEITPELASVGPSVNLRLPYGELEAAAAASRTHAGWGAASVVSYMYAGRSASAGGSVRLTSDQYRNVSLIVEGERPSAEWSVFGSVPATSRASVTAQHSHVSLREQTSRHRSEVLASIRLTRRADLAVSTAHVEDVYGRRWNAFAGVTVQMGHVTASTAVVRDADGARSVVEAQQPLPVGTGYGFHLRTENGPRDAISGAAQYQGRFGRYELRREALDGQYHSRLSAAGALVGIGGRMFASRPVQSSFALVRVPGVKGVRGFASHQEVGRTDGRGNLLIPDLQPYYGNILNIADADIPLEYTIPEVGMTLAPPYRGGALALFPVQRVQSIIGTVVILSGEEERVPTYGELRLTVDGKDVASPVGTAGEFYFENLPSGRHAAVVMDQSGSCEFTLSVPSSDNPVVSLGKLECRAVTR